MSRKCLKPLRYRFSTALTFLNAVTMELTLSIILLSAVILPTAGLGYCHHHPPKQKRAAKQRTVLQTAKQTKKSF